MRAPMLQSRESLTVQPCIKSSNYWFSQAYCPRSHSRPQHTPAHEFGLHDRGRFAVGLRSHLVLVKGDPTVEIQALHNLGSVWKLGKRQLPRVRRSRWTVNSGTYAARYTSKHAL